MIVDHEEVKIFQLEQEAVYIHSRLKSNTIVASKCLKGLKGSTYDPMIDMKDSLLDSDEKYLSH